jgi:spore coat protein U-like protein
MKTDLLIVGTVILINCFVVSGAFAANIDALVNNGNADTATGNFDLNIAKNDAVSITGMRTLAISGDNAGQDKTGSINVCTYATTPNYQIDINSLAVGGPSAAVTTRFDADDGTGKLMNYDVKWNDRTNNWDFNDNLDPSQTGASPNTTDPTCGGGTNTTITVTVRNSDFNKVRAGIYTDTLEVIITAQ